jgi:hypothetical protein
VKNSLQFSHLILPLMAKRTLQLLKVLKRVFFSSNYIYNGFHNSSFSFPPLKNGRCGTRYYEMCSVSNEQGKISSQWCTLERWVHTAQICRLTSRADQSILKTATPSSPGYDGGTHFCHRTCQGCKKLARIKLLDNNTFGNKTC